MKKRDKIKNNKIKKWHGKKKNAHGLHHIICITQWAQKGSLVALKTQQEEIQNKRIKTRCLPYFAGWLCCSNNIYKLRFQLFFLQKRGKTILYDFHTDENIIYQNNQENQFSLPLCLSFSQTKLILRYLYQSSDKAQESTL